MWPRIQSRIFRDVLINSCPSRSSVYVLTLKQGDQILRKVVFNDDEVFQRIVPDAEAKEYASQAITIDAQLRRKRAARSSESGSSSSNSDSDSDTSVSDSEEGENSISNTPMAITSPSHIAETHPSTEQVVSSAEVASAQTDGVVKTSAVASETAENVPSVPANLEGAEVDLQPSVTISESIDSAVNTSVEVVTPPYTPSDVPIQFIRNIGKSPFGICCDLPVIDLINSFRFLVLPDDSESHQDADVLALMPECIDMPILNVIESPSIAAHIPDEMITKTSGMTVLGSISVPADEFLPISTVEALLHRSVSLKGSDLASTILPAPDARSCLSPSSTGLTPSNTAIPIPSDQNATTPYVEYVPHPIPSTMPVYEPQPIVSTTAFSRVSPTFVASKRRLSGEPDLQVQRSKFSVERQSDVEIAHLRESLKHAESQLQTKQPGSQRHNYWKRQCLALAFQLDCTDYELPVSSRQVRFANRALVERKQLLTDELAGLAHVRLPSPKRRCPSPRLHSNSSSGAIPRQNGSLNANGRKVEILQRERKSRSPTRVRVSPNLNRVNQFNASSTRRSDRSIPRSPVRDRRNRNGMSPDSDRIGSSVRRSRLIDRSPVYNHRAQNHESLASNRVETLSKRIPNKRNGSSPDRDRRTRNQRSPVSSHVSDVLTTRNSDHNACRSPVRDQRDRINGTMTQEQLRLG